jgi:hypothetical protein
VPNAAQYLAEPVRQFLAAGGTLTIDELAQIHSDTGVPLGDLEVHWRDGQATGELFKIYFALANTDPSRASWENAAKLVRSYAAKHDVSASRSLLHDVRSRYRSVAHLWAAWCIRGRKMQSDPDVHYEGGHDFHLFLTESEILLRWGRNYRERIRTAQLGNRDNRG